MQSLNCAIVRRKALITAAILAASSISYRATAAQVGNVWVIALENHNFTQPASFNGSINAIKGDPAAPFIQSLITPGNANAAQVSYETAYYQPGLNEHPSEPNYVWAEAGTNFNPIATGASTSTTQGPIIGNTITSDSDPSAAAKNILTVPHLTGQLNAAGIPWKNYQEDYQYSSSVLVSATGTGGTHNGNVVVANPYNGSTQYNYAVKHNPMAFFTDTATQNVEPMSQLTTDLASNSVGRYNWITPNQYNDMHSALTGGFTDPRTSIHYTGDQAEIAQGDNFLSIVVPQIMGSAAYQNNGAIIIWNDETEGADDTTATSTEIVISPLAKGNAYASSVVTNHSSDIKTMEQLFGLPQIDNAIPTSEVFATGGFATVQGSNDLSDLFVANAVPEPGSLALLGFSAIGLIRRGRRKA
ncbi:MAG TPA: alkaline phosphatase family protein [Tepidisphaeraceae bacterium]|jgi:hypothetical protein|nr:alkaline phosphatase family protein [Tepidisphaeraceae bacterium]